MRESVISLITAVEVDAVVIYLVAELAEVVGEHVAPAVFSY